MREAAEKTAEVTRTVSSEAQLKRRVAVISSLPPAILHSLCRSSVPSLACRSAPLPAADACVLVLPWPQEERAVMASEVELAAAELETAGSLPPVWGR